MKNKRVVAACSAVMIGLTSTVSSIPNTVFATDMKDMAIKQDLGEKIEKIEEDVSLENEGDKKETLKPVIETKNITKDTTIEQETENVKEVVPLENKEDKQEVSQTNTGNKNVEQKDVFEKSSEEESDVNKEQEESNGTQLSDWIITSSTNTYVVLGKYQGDSKDIVIPGELEGKQVKIGDVQIPKDVTSLTIKEVNDKKVKSNSGNLSKFLSDCKKLKSVNLSGLDTKGVKEFDYMFNNCESLIELKGLENWDTLSVTSMGYMFSGCSSLTDISSLKNWNTSSVNNMLYMFLRCSSLADISYLKDWDLSSVVDMRSMFSGCSSLTDLSSLKNWDISSAQNISSVFSSCTKLKNLTGIEYWDTSSVVYIDSMFSGCSSLTDISPLSKWDVSSSNTTNGMFYGCSSLTDISSLSEWNTSSVKNMNGTFNLCKKLENLTGIEDWDTSSVTTMNNMFFGCSSLTDLSALKNWDTSSVTTMSSTFRLCGKLKNLTGLDNWNISSVVWMNEMFYACPSLIDISSLKDWDTSSVKYMADTFGLCRGLENVTGIENWDTSSVTDMSNMFWGNRLREVNLSKWKTTALKDMSSMFEAVVVPNKEIIIDLSGFTLSNDIKMDKAFNLNGSDNKLIVITKDEKLKSYDYKNDDLNPSFIIFDANGGFFSDGSTKKQGSEIFTLDDISDATINKKIEESKSNVDIPTREKLDFRGWSLNQTGEMKNISNDSIFEKLNAKYYARWQTDAVVINQAPTIVASDKVLIVGDEFNPLDGVTAYDKEDGEITLTEENIISSDVNMNEAGTYTVTYKVTDSKGASSVKTITITVKAKENSEKPENPNEPENPDKPNGGDDKVTDNNQVNNIEKLPQTGDTTNIGLFGAMLAVSSGLLAILFRKKHRLEK